MFYFGKTERVSKELILSKSEKIETVILWKPMKEKKIPKRACAVVNVF